MSLDKRYKIEWAEYVAGEGYAEIIKHLGFDPAGCEHCNYGIVAEPDTEHVVAPLWMRRAIAASRGAVLFCDCGSGKATERHVGKDLMKIPAYMLNDKDKSEMLRENEQGRYFWAEGQAPDVYVPSTTVRAILDVTEASPTVHMEGMEAT